MIEQKSLSRRSFLAGAGIVTGAAVVAAGTSLIKPKSAEAAFTNLPWTYATLDLATVKRRGYDRYGSNGGCMAGTAIALIESLIEASAGAAWESIPWEMLKYGRGGIAGSWGTLCGSLNGASLVIQACAPNVTVAGNLINALYDWYCGFNFPSTDHDAYATGYENQTRTICNSPLCHASVSKWCNVTGSKVTDSARSKRCAKVAGDVAGKTADLLNNYFASAAIPAFTQPDASCASCHLGGNAQHWVQMKSTCTTMCHTAERNPCTKP